MSVATKADPAVPAGSARPLERRRPLGDRAFALLALGSGLLVLVILILIAITTTNQAKSWFTTYGWKIFTVDWSPATNNFGAASFI